MGKIRGYLKPVSFLLILAMVNLTLPPPAARAAMVSTETVIGEAMQIDPDRVRIREFIMREDVRAVLTSEGVDPDEALARVDALSDREVGLIAQELDKLPAGAALSSDEAILGGGVILILGFLIIIVYTVIVFLFVQIVD